MLAIPRFDAYRLSESIGFVRDLLELSQKNPVPLLETQLAELTTSYEKLAGAYKKEQGSPLTLDIAEADSARDRLYVGLRKLCEAYTYSPESAEREAAETLLRNIRHYGTDAHRLNYQAQSTVMDNLLTDWAEMPELKAASETLNATRWTAELSAYNEAVKATLLNRLQKQATEVQGDTAELRKETLAAYREWVKYAEAHSLLNPSPALQTLVSEHDQLVEQYNLILKRRQADETKTDTPTA